MGFIMNIAEMSEALKQARINAGISQGKTWRNGDPKPLTQIEASAEIGVSLRKYNGVEAGEYNFADASQEQNAINFINKYKGKK